MNRCILLLLLAVSISGCTNMESVPHRIALLHVGMTQQEVTDLLGKPHAIANQGALLVYDYVFTQPHPAMLNASEPPVTSYYVIIGRQDGRVRSFGPN
jgi:outer membrane protein assembly factor BamE (lipoprotein component of BamABCDE complex)